MAGSVFDSLSYAALYELDNLLFDNGYGKIARDSINLADIAKGSRGLDIGCGTTCKLVDMVPGIKVKGIEKSGAFLNLAKVKFGYGDLKRTLENIGEDRHLPEILKKHRRNLPGLAYHLLVHERKYGPHSKDGVVELESGHAAEVALKEGEEPFDFALLNQVIHWFINSPPEGESHPEYQRKALTAINNTLRPGGKLIFNTSGADFRFHDERINRGHFMFHPYYQIFNQEVARRLGGEIVDAERFEDRTYTFDDSKIREMLDNTGFRVTGTAMIGKDYEDFSLMRELCIVGAHMTLFETNWERSGTDKPMLSEEDRNLILEEALEVAERESSVDAQPVREGIAHYVAIKE